MRVSAADGEVDWKVVCVGCEKERRRWSDIVEHIHHYYILASNFVVDSVHVLQVAVPGFWSGLVRLSVDVIIFSDVVSPLRSSSSSSPSPYG